MQGFFFSRPIKFLRHGCITVRNYKTRWTPKGKDHQVQLLPQYKSPPAIMKYSFIATIVVLALAQGGFAQDASDLERLSQYFDEMKTKLIADMTEIIQSHDVANQAQAFIEDKTQLQPLVSQIQEQLRSAATNVEEQIRPLTANVQAQLQPQIESFQKQMEAVFDKLSKQTLALAQ